MATALLLLRAVARRDARKLSQFLNQNSSVLAHSWSEKFPDEAATVVGRGYSTLVREVDGVEKSFRFSDFLMRRGFSLKSAVEQEQGKVEVKVEGNVEGKVEEKVSEAVVKVKRVGRPRKVADGVDDKVVKPRRKPRVTMKQLEEEIAANEAASGSSAGPPVELKLTRKKRSGSRVKAVAGADSGELAVSSVDDSSFDVVGVAPQFGKLASGEEVRGQDSSALADDVIDSLNSEAVGESSNAILSSLVEDGESQVQREQVRKVFPPLKGARDAADSPPRTAPKFPKLDLTSKQRIISVELDGDEGNERGAKVLVPAQYSDPKKVFHMLQHARPGSYTSTEKARLSWIFHRFSESGLVRQSLADL